MPVRWVINPVIETIGPNDERYRKPKVAAIIDPGRPPRPGTDDAGDPIDIPQTYSHVSCISDGLPGQQNDWCLSQVWGVDFTPLDADPEVIDLLEMDYGQDERGVVLAKRGREHGVSAAKMGRIIARLRDKGADVTAITKDTPVHETLRRLGRVINPQFDPRLERTSL